jgi:hypothetical protein
VLSAAHEEQLLFQRLDEVYLRLVLLEAVELQE